MTLAAFQSLSCHNGILASVTSPSGDVEDRLELRLHLSATFCASNCPFQHGLCEFVPNFVLNSVFCFDFGGFCLFITLSRVRWLADLDWTGSSAACLAGGA